jgi:ribonuclease E
LPLCRRQSPPNPAPIHVPRERPPLVISDEGPLVLVETRKDLRNLNLPF